MRKPTKTFLQSKPREIAYRYWVDRMTPYYITARSILLTPQNNIEAGAFCSFQAIENILKGALYYHESPSSGHNLQKLAELLRSKGYTISIPQYFNNYQSIARYPESVDGSMGSGLLIAGTTLQDLDSIISTVIIQTGDKGRTRLSEYFESSNLANNPLSTENNAFQELAAFFTAPQDRQR